MYHTSPTPINPGTINHCGVAGDCLFFSNDIYVMTAQNFYYVYEAQFDCVPVHQLYDEDIVTEIAEYFDCSAELAESLLDARDSLHNQELFDAEGPWWLQGKRGECAVKMGYDGCEDIDEQGTVYIVPMTGRESELVLRDIKRK